MARLHIVISDDLERELDLLCVNKSELARRGILMALEEVKKNFKVQLAAANDPAPIPPAPTATVTPEPSPAPTPEPPPAFDPGIERNTQRQAYRFQDVCRYLDVDPDEAANDMMNPPEEGWVTRDQVLEICTLSPHPAKADSLKQWA